MPTVGVGGSAVPPLTLTFSGEPKLRQSVTPTGSAPTHARFLTASATACAAPLEGSSPHAKALQSVVAARAVLVPGTRTSAASAPGSTTVPAPTDWSYC